MSWKVEMSKCGCGRNLEIRTFLVCEKCKNYPDSCDPRECKSIVVKEMKSEWKIANVEEH